ncbi:MAG: type I secretion system permease/ATPase, partial [Alphaproteobacteria bacterium]
MAGNRETPDIDLLGDVRPRIRAAIGGVALLSAALNILLLSGSIYMILVYDLVIPGRSEATLMGLLVLVVAAYLFQGVLDLLRGRVLTHLAANVDTALEGAIHRLVSEMARLAPQMDGNQPVRDLDQVRGFLSGGGPTALVDLPWMLFFIGVLFFLH